MLSSNLNIRLAQPSDVEDIMFIMKDTKKNMKNKSWLCTDGMNEEYLCEIMKSGFILVAEDFGGIGAFLIVWYPKDSEENLGRDLNLPKKELSKVVHMEMVAVVPELRGRGLQFKLMKKAEDILSVMHFRYYMATVHPKNVFCMTNLKLLGYTVKDTKVKYGGTLRNIMIKVK